MKIKALQHEIEEILVKDPRARDSDMFLYGVYLTDKIGLVSAVTFFINFSKYSGIASFETVSRTRRRIQELHPELQASKKVQEARDELQGSFFDYARGFDADV